MLRDESAAFAAIGEDFIASLIRELDQNIAKLAKKIQLAKAPEDDLREEVVVADLIESGQHPDTVIVHLLGAFKRKFSRDIERIETSDEWQNRQEQLLLFLNRNGLYDHLPQGLMHQPLPSKKRPEMPFGK